jgi:ADP-ribose pyrophosphatase
MAERAKILGETLLAEGRFRLTRTRVEIEETNGAVRTLDHEVYHYGPAAAVLLYELERRVVLLVKQFRVAAFLSDGTLDVIEACAGMLDGDAPQVCATREA